MDHGIYSGSSARTLLLEGIQLAVEIARKRIGPAGNKTAPSLSQEIASLQHTARQRPGLQIAHALACKIETKCAGGSCQALILLEFLLKESAQRKRVPALKDSLEVVLEMARNCVLESSFSLDSIETLASFYQKKAPSHPLPLSSYEPLFRHMPSANPLFVHFDQNIGSEEPLFQQEPALCIPSFKPHSAKPFAIHCPSLLISHTPLYSPHQIAPLLNQCMNPTEKLCIFAPKIEQQVLSTISLRDSTLKSQIFAMQLPPQWNSSQTDLLCRFSEGRPYQAHGLKATFGKASALHLDYEGGNVLINDRAPMQSCELFALAGSLHFQSSISQPLVRAIDLTRKAALSGVSWGAGLAFARAAKTLEYEKKKIDSSLKEALQIVINALKEPHNALISNRGYRGKVVTENILNDRAPFEGFDIEKEEICSFQEHLILDPTSQLCDILRYTSATLKNLLETETLILRNEQKSSSSPQ